MSFLACLCLNDPLQNGTLTTEISTANQPSQSTTDGQIASTPMDDIYHPQSSGSSTPEMQDVDTAIVCWECTTCGRRYVGPSEVGFFIPPPPSTECTKAQINQKGAHTSGCLPGVSVAVGSTCEYVRINRNSGKTDLDEQSSEREDHYRPMVRMAQSYVSVYPWDTTPTKAEGQSGRTGRSDGRSNRGADAACEDADLEDCDFWKAECKDIDCIYRGCHCRYQCAMAESDEEPKTKVAAPERVLRLWRSAVNRG